MQSLQRWMDRNKKVDADVADAVRISRPHVSRIRRGLTAASPEIARRLEALTGIKWFYFIERVITPKTRKIKRKGV